MRSCLMLIRRNWWYKFIAIILIVVLLPIGGFAGAETEENIEIPLGDVDGNGIVDLADATVINQYIIGQIDELPYPVNADVNEDGEITVEDLLVIVQRETGSSRTVVARPEYGLPGKIFVGSMVRIEVFERFFPSDVSGGTVRIKSPSTGYDSGDQPLASSPDGRSLYYHWDTTDLDYISIYEVSIELRRSSASEDDSTEPDKSISIDKRIFEIPYLARVQDAYVLAPGIPLDFIRTFPQDSSHTPYFGPLGRGWTHTYNMFLDEFTDGTVAFFGPDGFNRWFVRNEDGTYTASPGDYGELTRDSDGSFQLREKYGLVYRFNSDLRLQYIQDPNGNRASCIYNGQSQLIEIRHSSGTSLKLEYNAAGRITKLIDQAGRQTVYEYYPNNFHLLTVTDPAEYYPNNVHLRTVTDPAGSVTRYTYSLGYGDATDHRLTSIAFPDGTYAFYAYDTDGSLLSQEGNNGIGRTTYAYKEDGTTLITDAVGSTTEVKVNDYGQVTTVTDPLGYVNEFEYDTDLNLIRITNPRDATYTLQYDERGNAVQVTDPARNEINLGYEPSYSNIAWLQDNLGRTSTFSYDLQGNLLNITYPDGSKESYTYDDRNHLESRTGRDGQIIDYALDNRGLVLSKAYPDGTSAIYTYDEAGRLISARNATNTIDFEYDLMDRITSATYDGGRSFEYEYNPVGKRTVMIDPDGKILKYRYDEGGRLIRIADGSDNIIVEYKYNAANERTKKILGNGAYSTYEYDAAGQTLQLNNYDASGTVISYFKYEYDGAGNRLSKETIEGIESYEYDDLNQLTSVNYPNGTTTGFVYDAMGNRLSVIENGEPVSYMVNDLNQYTAVGPTTYEYDLNGNLISKTDGGQTTFYDYDFENRLTNVRTPDDMISYTYNALGLRSSSSDFESAVHYLWDMAQVVIEESNAHQTVARYVWGDVLDEVVRMDRGGSSNYYVQDAVLSVSDLTDASGDLVEHYRYRVFGEPLLRSNVGNPWLFAGLPYSFQIGLQYNRFRYYSQDLGRFVTPDPVNIDGGFNLYAYVENNPMLGADRMGLDFWYRWERKQNRFFRNRFGRYIYRARDLPNVTGLPNIPIVYPYPGGDTRVYSWPEPEGSWVHLNPFNRAWWASGWIPVGGVCPTFIQLPPHSGSAVLRSTYLDVSQEKLDGKITVPIDDCLLRSDIPIFGVAGGKDFKEYRVEYGAGRSPTEWHLIESSNTPQETTDVGIGEMQLMQGDIDIRGNLATWNTGLRNWVHLPWHPPEDPTNFNGIYTIRLVVEGEDGDTVEDRVTCEVGRVIAQCLPGITISPDQRVIMRFPEHSLTEPFRVYTILPLPELGEEAPIKPQGIQLIGPIYRIREPGDRFTKDVILEFFASNEDLQGLEAQHIGILRYDAEECKWIWLETMHEFEDESTIAKTALVELPVSPAIYALGYDSQNVRSQPRTEDMTVEPLTASDPVVLVDDTFEEGTGSWQSRDRFVGGVLNRVRAASDGSYALQISNQATSGSYGVTVLGRPFDLRHYPIISFDYRICPGVKTDFYFLVNGRWHNLGFTDDYNDFRNRDVNITNLGQIDGIIADDQWHSATVNLYELLRKKTRYTQVDAVMMADWDVTGYMKLDFGNNMRGVAYYIDNFKISACPSYDSSSVLIVDTFEDRDSTNLLGGDEGTFSSPDADYCQIDTVEDSTTQGNNHVLEVTFDATQPDSYCGYWTSLMNADLCDMREISLRLYAPEPVPPILLGLRYNQWVEPKIPVESYLSAPDANGWRQVVIPISAFVGLPTLSSIKAISVTFENELMSGKGQILIDDIQFNSRPSSGEVLDSDMLGTDSNLLGGGFNIIDKEAAVISSGHHEDRVSSPVVNTIRISYGGAIGLDYGEGRFSYAIWETDLRGFDARGFQDIVLNIRGENGGEKPNIWLDDGTTRRPVRAQEFAPITTSWQEIRIPLEKFTTQSVDLSHIEAIQVVFEWEEMSGTIYIADIRFE